MARLTTAALVVAAVAAGALVTEPLAVAGQLIAGGEAAAGLVRVRSEEAYDGEKGGVWRRRTVPESAWRCSSRRWRREPRTETTS